MDGSGHRAGLRRAVDGTHEALEPRRVRVGPEPIPPAGENTKARGEAFSVRPATEADLPGVLSCLARVFEPFRAGYTPEAFLHTVLDERLGQERLATMRVLVAVGPDGRVLGTVSWFRPSPTSGHLRGMAVLPEFQGTGVAQGLLDQAVAEIRDNGCRKVTLRTPDPLDRAVRFYTRNGFRPSGAVADFYGMVVTERVRDLDVPGP